MNRKNISGQNKGYGIRVWSVNKDWRCHNMKSVKREILYILFILSIQIVVTFLIAHFTNKTWNIKDFIANYIFITFWGTYIICKMGIVTLRKFMRK